MFGFFRDWINEAERARRAKLQCEAYAADADKLANGASKMKIDKDGNKITSKEGSLKEWADIINSGANRKITMTSVQQNHEHLKYEDDKEFEQMMQVVITDEFGGRGSAMCGQTGDVEINNVYAREVWNAAIEECRIKAGSFTLAAGKTHNEKLACQQLTIDLAIEIGKLKK